MKPERYKRSPATAASNGNTNVDRERIDNRNGNSDHMRPPPDSSPKPSRPSAVTNVNSNPISQVPPNIAYPANFTPVSRSTQAEATTLPPIDSSGIFSGLTRIIRNVKAYLTRSPPPQVSIHIPDVGVARSPLFTQVTSATSKQNHDMNRVRGSTFNKLASPKDSLFPQEPTNRKLYTRGMALFSEGRNTSGSGCASGARLNDLRGHVTRMPQAAPSASLKEDHPTDKRRSDYHGIGMSSSSRRILAAIRTKSEENILCRKRKPLAPLGPPPSLKRARDESEEPTRKQARRKAPNLSRVAQVRAMAGPSHQRDITADNSSSNGYRQTWEVAFSIRIATPSNSALRHRSRNEGSNPAFSTPGSADRKRRLGDEDNGMQRPSKRIAAVKKAGEEDEKNTSPDPVKETAKKPDCGQ